MGQYVNPQNTTSEIASLIDESQSLVESRFEQAMQYADGVMNLASSFLNLLQSSIDSYDWNTEQIGAFFPNPAVYNYNIGDAPEAPEVEIYLPEFPTEPVIQAITMLTNISNYLQNVLDSGARGIDEEVEEYIWRRNEERDRIALQEAKERAAEEWAKRGYYLPNGALAAQITQIETEYMNKRLDLSRDIAIKQAETAFQNTQFIIQQILTMENLVISAVSKDNENKIDKFKADVDAYKQKIQAAIEKLSAQLRAYEVQGNVYKAKADAQSSIAAVDIKSAEAQINTAIAQMQLWLKQAELNMKNNEVMAQLRLEAAKAGGSIAAHLASGVMAGVSVQAHIAGTGSASKSYSGSESVSESYPHKNIS